MTLVSLFENNLMNFKIIMIKKYVPKEDYTND